MAAPQQKKKSILIRTQTITNGRSFGLAVVLVDLGSVDFPEEIYSNFLEGRENGAHGNNGTTDTTTADSKAGI